MIRVILVLVSVILFTYQAKAEEEWRLYNEARTSYINLPPKPTTLNFTGPSGEKLLIIDLEKRTITTEPNVKVDAAAEAIFKVLEGYLRCPRRAGRDTATTWEASGLILAALMVFGLNRI